MPPASSPLSGTGSRQGDQGREQPSAHEWQTLFPPPPLPIAIGHSSRVRSWEQLAGEWDSLARGLTALCSNDELAPARRLLPSPYGRGGPARGGVTARPTCSSHTHARHWAPLCCRRREAGTAAPLLRLKLAA